jgi:hypothetical protein
MKQAAFYEHLVPWAGLIGAGFAWALAHQIGADSVFDDCRRGSAAFILLVNLVGLALAAGGGYFSWCIWRRPDESEGRRFLGLAGLLFAALLSFALLLQAISGLLVPSCLQ